MTGGRVASPSSAPPAPRSSSSSRCSASPRARRRCPSAPSLRVLFAPLAPGLDAGIPAPLHRVVLDLRLPRVVLAAAVGSGLAVVGALLQTATRNDLADPFLFGLSSGAAAGAASVIALFGYRLGPWTLPAAAFAGALLSAGIVFGLASTQDGRGGERLVLAGLAVSFLFGAVTLFLVFAGDQRATASVLFWSVGGLGLAAWGNLPLGARRRRDRARHRARLPGRSSTRCWPARTRRPRSASTCAGCAGRCSCSARSRPRRWWRWPG